MLLVLPLLLFDGFWCFGRDAAECLCCAVLWCFDSGPGLFWLLLYNDVFVMRCCCSASGGVLLYGAPAGLQADLHIRLLLHLFCCVDVWVNVLMWACSSLDAECCWIFFDECYHTAFFDGSPLILRCYALLDYCCAVLSILWSIVVLSEHLLRCCFVAVIHGPSWASLLAWFEALWSLYFCLVWCIY